MADSNIQTLQQSQIAGLGTYNVNLQPTPPATGPALPTDRATAKERYFTAGYETLISAIWDYDLEHRLLPGDADSILCLLAEELPRYRGKLSEQSFSRWALRFVEKQVKRYGDTSTILAANQGIIRAAITRTLPWVIFDCAVSTDDYEQDIAVRVFKEALSLAETGPQHTAKQSSRVYAMTRKHILDYPCKTMRKRLNAILRRIAKGKSPYGKIDNMSQEEYDAIKAEEMDEAT